MGHWHDPPMQVDIMIYDLAEEKDRVVVLLIRLILVLVRGGGEEECLGHM